MFSPNSVNSVKHGVTSTLGTLEDYTTNFCFLCGCFSRVTKETAFVKLAFQYLLDGDLGPHLQGGILRLALELARFKDLPCPSPQFLSASSRQQLRYGSISASPDTLLGRPGMGV